MIINSGSNKSIFQIVFSILIIFTSKLSFGKQEYYILSKGSDGNYNVLSKNSESKSEEIITLNYDEIIKADQNGNLMGDDPKITEKYKNITSKTNSTNSSSNSTSQKYKLTKPISHLQQQDYFNPNSDRFKEVAKIQTEIDNIEKLISNQERNETESTNLADQTQKNSQLEKLRLQLEVRKDQLDQLQPSLSEYVVSRLKEKKNSYDELQKLKSMAKDITQTPEQIAGLKNEIENQKKSNQDLINAFVKIEAFNKLVNKVNSLENKLNKSLTKNDVQIQIANALTNFFNSKNLCSAVNSCSRLSKKDVFETIKNNSINQSDKKSPDTPSTTSPSNK